MVQLIGEALHPFSTAADSKCNLIRSLESFGMATNAFRKEEAQAFPLQASSICKEVHKCVYVYKNTHETMPMTKCHPSYPLGCDLK